MHRPLVQVLGEEDSRAASLLQVLVLVQVAVRVEEVAIAVTCTRVSVQ